MYTINELVPTKNLFESAAWVSQILQFTCSLSSPCCSLVRCLPGQTLPDSIKNTYKKGHWTEFMGRVMNYIGKNWSLSLWYRDALISTLMVIFQDVTSVLIYNKNR